MPLKLKDISSYLSFAKKLSNTSEEILKKTPSSRIKINFKSDKSPVTKIDMAIERKLRSMINKRFPNHGIFGEEYKNKTNNSPFLWVIDPIDGTKNFINGNNNFGTLISLCIDYTPVIGIINCPEIKKTWIGIRDNGAYCNGKKISKSSNNLPLSKLYFSTSGMTAFKSNNKNKKYNTLIKKTKYATFGGDCVQYGLLAEKRIPLVVESFLKPYDYIPLINIVEESGGIISDWKGNPLDFKSNGDVIASISKKAHQQFIKI
jgi:histidinol phosphatase-like enzyme (inositol monophosphatase family)